MLDGKQVTTIIMIMLMFFAVPATVVTFISQDSTDQRSGASTFVENSSAQGVSFLEGVKDIFKNPDYFYIIAIISFIAFLLITILLIQKSREKDINS